MKILLVLILVMPATAATQVCDGLKTFLGLRNSYTIRAPMSKVKSPDRLLSCVHNCALLKSCRSYRFYSTQEKCILQDEKGTPIITKEIHEINQPATQRSTNAQRAVLGKCGHVGFTYLPSSKTCVKIYKKKKTWLEAMEFCHSLNGTLVVIKTAQKQEAVSKLARSQKTEAVWIGAWDKKNTNTFEWCDGSPMNYTAWASRQPSHRNFLLQEENCAQMPKWARYQGNDCKCDRKYYFICESDQVKVVS